MTCVLGMVVQREREIRNFVKTPYYKIIGTFGEENSSFTAEWKVTEKSYLWESPKLYNESGFRKEDNAKQFILSLKEKKARITEVKKSKTKENAPLLFNLAEIQNEAAKRFKIKPDETLEIIQNLYEKKLVTYPRTDARVLSTAVAKVISKNLNGLAKGFQDEEIQGYLKKMAEEKYSTNLLKTKYVNDSKITDHYAIIPTGQGFENYNQLPELQKQMYKVIVKRFLSIFYPPAEYSKISVTIEVEHEKANVSSFTEPNISNFVENKEKNVSVLAKEQFSASGKVCEKLGYLEIAKSDEKQQEKTQTKKQETKTLEQKEGNNSEINTEILKQEQENNLPKEEQEESKNNLEVFKKLKKGEEIKVLNYETKTSETSPPSRYNSGSMILAMENAGKLIEEEELREQIRGAGIGTSATRAEIMKKLERIGYIAINNKTQIITPTLKGEKIYDVVYQCMPDMLNPKLTASWEKGLDMVAKSEIQPEEFMKKLETYINSKFNKLIIREVK
jgi:DNA topoisomerase-3